MNTNHPRPPAASPRGLSSLGYDAVHVSGGLMLLIDLSGLLIAAVASSAVYARWLAPPDPAIDLASHLGHTALLATALAPAMLYDRNIGRRASRGRTAQLMTSTALRLVLIASLLLVIGILAGESTGISVQWLILWFCSSLAVLSIARLLGVRYLRHLQGRGRLREVVAIVGHGPLSTRIVRTLHEVRPGTLDIIGIFDDCPTVGPGAEAAAHGDIAELLELGKSRTIDWILLALPPDQAHRIPPLVQRLKALSAPIGLCSSSNEAALPCRGIDFIGNSVPVSMLTDQPADWIGRHEGLAIPRWLVTLAQLPTQLIGLIAARLAARRRIEHTAHPDPLTLEFDDLDETGFAEAAAQFGQGSYGYVVTPNADHMIRLHDSAAFRALYANASYVLLDSRFVSHMVRVTRGLRLPVCPGSDLTATLFSRIARPGDALVLIGGRTDQAAQLSARFGLTRLAHYNPPMGFIHDAAEVSSCLAFIESHSPFRFCLLAVGSPQQEQLAYLLQQRGVARGLSLCVGASIDFLTGDERRAPGWLQRAGMEWLWRLMQAPRRMSRRYLVRGPRIFRLLHGARVVLRPGSMVTTALARPAIATHSPAMNA